MKRTKVIELNATGLSQYLDQTNVGVVFAYLDNNSVFKTASSTQNENKKDIEMVPKKREKSKLKKKTQSSR